MFGKTKDGSSEGDRVVTPIQHGARPAASPSSTQNASSDESTISAGMTIVGKITGEGTVNIFGRVEGELRASTVMIAQGAEVEGDIVADDLSVGGRVKGTIHANRVKLNGSASVEGDIFHRSLSIEENARFEGSSRRDEAALETPRIPLVRTPPVQTQTRPADSSPKPNGAPDSAHASPAA